MDASQDAPRILTTRKGACGGGARSLVGSGQAFRQRQVAYGGRAVLDKPTQRIHALTPVPHDTTTTWRTQCRIPSIKKSRMFSIPLFHFI
jgi:hypothetical protein